MIYRELDLNGDYTFGKNMQNFISGAAAVAQAIKTNLLLLKEEWWEDTEEGLPLFQNIIGQKFFADGNIQSADLIIKDRIANTQGVLTIIGYNSMYDNRKLSISCTVITIFGESASVEVSF